MSYQRKKNKLRLSCYRSKQENKVQRICDSIQQNDPENESVRQRGRPRKRRIADSIEDSNLESCKTSKVDSMDSDVMSSSLHIQVDNEGDVGDKEKLESVPENEWEDITESDATHGESQNKSADTNTDNSSKLDNEFVKKCFKELRNEKLVGKLVQTLYSNKCLKDFMTMVKQLANGTFSPLNISFLLCLETAKWYSLKTTTQMRFRPVTKKFWTVVYRLVRGIGIRLFSGPKNWGQVVAQISKKGCNDPKKSQINFAVPDERHLRKLDNKLGKILPPGGIEDAFRLIENKENIVLMADCKRISRGLGKDTLGEENLWGFEDAPNLHERTENLKTEIKFFQRIVDEHGDMDIFEKYNHGKTVMRLLIGRLKEVRQFEMGELKKLTKYEQQNPDANYKAYAKSAAKTYIYNCRVFVKTAIKLNMQVCELLSTLQLNRDLLNTNYIVLTQRSNMRLLHAPSVLKRKMLLDEHPKFIKYASKEWISRNKQCRVTARTCYDALGFGGMKAMKGHFHKYIYDHHHDDDDDTGDFDGNCTIDEISRSATVQQSSECDRQDQQNKMNCLATLSGVLMPALLPQCSILYEVGIYLVDGYETSELFGSSPDGLIQSNHFENCTNDKCCSDDLFDITEAGNGICLKIQSSSTHKAETENQYQIGQENVIELLAHMYATNTKKLWFLQCAKDTVTLFECSFDGGLWRDIWDRVCYIYDKQRPTLPKRLSDITEGFAESFDHYIEVNSQLIAEVPIQHGEEGNLQHCKVFSPYHVPPNFVRTPVDYTLAEAELFHEICHSAINVVKEAHHILRREATEIIAFVATDSKRVPIPGIPCHLPLGYALKGNCLRMDTMRQMVNAIRNDCANYNANILCEVYDGQFINLIQRGDNGQPLTKLQLVKDLFNALKRWTKHKLISYLLHNAVADGNHVESIKTPNRKDLFQQHVAKYLQPTNASNLNLVHDLQEHDIDVLLQGSKLGRRRQARQSTLSNDDTLTDDDDDSSDDDDPDYIIDVEIDSDSFDTDISDDELEEELQLLEDSDSFENHDSTFLDDVLHELRKLKCKQKWLTKTKDDLVKNYLTDNIKAMKLTHEELDVFNRIIGSYTGAEIFKKSTPKKVKATQLIRNLGQYCHPDRTSTERIHQPTSLLILSKKFLLDKLYPKVFLCIVVAKCRIKWELQHWKKQSSIPLTLQIADEDEGIYFEHEIFSYPNFSAIRNQVEHRCTDPGHTLTNLRSQISRHGYDYVSKDAFIRVSTTNHETLPRSIVIDQLDKQSIRLAKRFFSVEVESVLTSNNDTQEAQFVNLVRNWFEACDERGISTFQRLRQLQRMYNFLLDKFDITEFPPPSQYIQGMPVQTFECIMQGISTRMALYATSELPINQRSISTLAVESFFSQLTQMEFSGLGCPKSVDIPRLITHVTELNNIRHDPNRGFEMATTSRNVYPYHLLDNYSDETICMFDEMRRRKQRTLPTSLALPKAITRGQPTIREYFRKDESKVPLHKRAGISDDYCPS